MTVLNFCGWETQEVEEACQATIVSNATQTYSTAQAYSGSGSLLIESTSNGGNVFKRYTRHNSQDMIWQPGDPNSTSTWLDKNDIWTGVAFYIDTLNGGYSRICQGNYNSGTARKWMVTVEDVSNELKLRFYDYNGNLQLTSSTTIESGNWYYVEARGGTGSSAPYEMRIDGVFEGSGYCDQYPVNNHWSYALCGGLGADSGTKIYYDCMYVNDSGFCGPCYVGYLHPSGDGTYQSWTGDYTDVDEDFPHDSSTTTITSSTVNQVETVELEDTTDFTDIDAIYAAKIGLFPKNNSGSTCSIEVRMRESGSNDDGNQGSVSSTYGTDWANTRTTPPSGGNWTIPKLDSMQGGLQHITGLSREIEVTRIFGAFLYNPTGAVTHSLKGTSDAVTTVTGSLSTTKKLAGTSAAVSTTVGYLSAGTVSLKSVVSAVSTVTGGPLVGTFTLRSISSVRAYVDAYLTGGTVPVTIEGLTFHTQIGRDYSLELTNKSLGFFGSQGSGDTVAIGDWQGSTYVVDGEVPYAQCANITYLNSMSGLVDGEVPLPLTSIPNYQASLNIRFAQPSATSILGAQCNFYDGVTTTEAPLGWNIRAAEIIHSGLIQDNMGFGDTTWHIASTGEHINLLNNPGPSGRNFDGFISESQPWHDWYLAISVSPDQVGSKHAGLNVYLEYL
jgi:hypothetical protein